MRVDPRKWVALASLAVLTAGAVGGRAQAPAGGAASAGKPAAVVNGEPVSQADVANFVGRVIKEQFKTQPPTEAQRRSIWTECANMMVDEALLRQFLARSSVQVPAGEVEKQFADMKNTVEKAGRKMDDVYRESGQNEQQLKNSILNVLRREEFAKTRVKEEDVKRYFDENREFFDRVTVHAAHILIRVAPTASDVEKQAARAKLATLRAEIVGGKADFAEAAKKTSQCTSAPNGGDIGFIPRKMLVDENFAKAAFALKPGEVSDVVQTEAGMHLIKCLERRPGEACDYAKEKDSIRECYVEEMMQNIIAQERRTAKIEMNPPW